MGVVVVKDPAASIALLSNDAMSFINVNGMSVVGYGWDGDIGRSYQCAEEGEQYRRWLSFLRNVEGGGGTLYTWRGALCQILLFPV